MSCNNRQTDRQTDRQGDYGHSVQALLLYSFLCDGVGTGAFTLDGRPVVCGVEDRDNTNIETLTWFLKQCGQKTSLFISCTLSVLSLPEA